MIVVVIHKLSEVTLVSTSPQLVCQYIEREINMVMIKNPIVLTNDLS